MDSIVSWIGEIPRSQAYTFAGFTAAYLALQYVDVHAANGGEVAAAPAPAPARRATAAPAPAPAPAPAAATPAANETQELAGLHFTDCVECATLIADKIEERVALARSKQAGGEEYDKAVMVLWGISVGKKTIFEEHETTQAEFDASCAALLGGGGVGSRGANLGELRAGLARVEHAKELWNKLLSDADEDINKKAGVSGRFKVGTKAPMDVALVGRNGQRTTMGGLLSEPRHKAGLLLVVLRHFG